MTLVTISAAYGTGGSRIAPALAERLGVPFLGEVPLNMTLRETSDAGRPVVAVEPDGPHARIYKDIARQVWGALAGDGARAARRAPRIVME